MKQLLSCLLVLTLAAPVAQSQEVTPNLTGGSKALLFSFAGLSFLNAGNFDGGFGAKYYLSEAMAVRAGLQFATGSTTNPANPPAGQSGVDGSQSATQIGVSAAIELHMGKGRVSPYLGGGIGFSTTSTEMKNAVVGNPPPSQTTTKNSVAGENIGGVNYLGGTAFTVYGLAGFEFFLWKELSLAGEYRLGFTSTSRKDQEVTAGTTTVTTKLGSSSGFSIASQGVLTLAVYF
ncbi:MAG: outer membrane beta-barrel protein [Ignavibacteriales bacterium]|nr:outer membrane beta-barrel protein [Ignavibacteriales bacterium]